MVDSNHLYGVFYHDVAHVILERPQQDQAQPVMIRRIHKWMVQNA